MYVEINGLPRYETLSKNNVSLILYVKKLTFFFFLRRNQPSFFDFFFGNSKILYIMKGEEMS